MTRAKVAITIDRDTLGQLDDLVRERVYENRSQAIQDAVNEKLERLNKTRLVRECAKLDPLRQQAIAEEAVGDVSEWPEY